VVFCVPALAGPGVFVIFPLFQAIFLAARGTDINGNPARSVGWANFAERASRSPITTPSSAADTRLSTIAEPVESPRLDRLGAFRR
jgi:hypothetical protein